MKIEDLSYDKVKAVIEKKKYAFFTGEMNMNIVGVRTNSRKADNFDDYMCLLWQENGINAIRVWDEFTTDPGFYYLVTKLLNPNGCAIVKPGQYRGLWTFGLHGTKRYRALVQRGEIEVYRDRNKDNILNEDPKTLQRSAALGINCHHGYESSHVGNNSAGCQVFRHKADLTEFLDILQLSVPKYGDKFTYTLLTEADFQ